MKNSSQHTPGPWKHVDHVNKSFGIKTHRHSVRAGDGIIIADVGPALIGNTIIGAKSQQICGANARLIAAAPELLAALELITWWTNDYVSDPAATIPINQARAALAKAKGQ